MVDFEINIEGNIYNEDLNKAMTILGELVINKIKDNIRSMDLMDGDLLLQNWIARFDGKKLSIDNTQEYMIYLEYGTYDYWNKYGLEGFPSIPDPKKKDISRSQAKKLPKGVQPFAFIRKVLYNNVIMTELISQAFSFLE